MFERFGLALHPDIVVLILVTNDLKNNSWLLQALEDGLSPDTPYSVEIRPASLNDPRQVSDWVTVQPIPIKDVVHLPRPPEAASDPVRRWLVSNSVLYQFLLHLSNSNFMAINDFLFARGNDVDVLGHYLEQVRQKNPELAPLLAGWPHSNWDSSSDYMGTVPAFEVQSPPLVFDFAVRASERAMDQWADLAKRENFKLVAMTKTDFVTLPQQTAMWQRILRERGIPLISQSDFYQAKGYAREDEHFLRDGHWNANGHRWAAESFVEFLKAHPDWLTPANVGGSQALSTK